MTGVLDINDPIDLLDYVLTELHQEITPEHIRLGDGFNIRIKLEGPQWRGGYVDHRLARYIIRLQDDLLFLYNQTAGEHINLRSSQEILRPLSVRIKVEEGSSLINLDLSSALEHMIKDMSSGELLILSGLAVVGWMSYLILGKYWHGKRQVEMKLAETKKDVELAKISAEVAMAREATLLKALEAVETANRLAQQAQSSTRYLVNCLEPDDRISIPAIGRNLSKEQAKEAIPPKPAEPSARPDTYWVDGEYTALLQNFRTYEVKLECDELSFVAQTNRLREPDKKALHDAFADGNINNQPPKIKLRVAITVNPQARNIIEGSILMLNPPEDGLAKPFGEFVSTVLQTAQAPAITTPDAPSQSG